MASFLKKGESSAIDIIDFWPGAGLLSSKVNEFLRPRHHLLVQSEEKTDRAVRPFLNDLLSKNASYKPVFIDPWQDQDWAGLLETYLPEQHRPKGTTQGELVKNDALLVLSSPFVLGSRKGHYTSARWWSKFVKTCAQQSELHTYGCVRLIALMPSAEAEIILPRAVRDRKGPALLTEAISSSVFEVASENKLSNWVIGQPWSLTERESARVSERAAEQGIVTPAGRERPPIPTIPREERFLQDGVRYVPHAVYGTMAELAATLAGRPVGEAAKKIPLAKNLMRVENRAVAIATSLTEEQSDIDESMRTLARAAADPNMDPDVLRVLDQKIRSMRGHVDESIRNQTRRVILLTRFYIDAVRAAGNLDDAVLLYDRRPFEPLQMEREELYPVDVPTSVLYFEADLNSKLAREISRTEPSKRNDLVAFIEATLPALVSQTNRTLAELFQLLFPGESANNLVQAIPGLSKVAAKSLKPGFEHLPKSDPQVPSGNSFQENINYDFFDIRVRALPAPTLIGILLAYYKAPTSLPAMELVRHLGGFVTSPTATRTFYPEKKIG